MILWFMQKIEIKNNIVYTKDLKIDVSNTILVSTFLLLYSSDFDWIKLFSLQCLEHLNE